MSADDHIDTLPDDPKPVPPREPAADECCGGGCMPCVYDRYWEAYARYEDALRAWQARQDKNNVTD